MNEEIHSILKRELGRLDTLSQGQGLALDDFRTLDLLIKAYKTLIREIPSDKPAPQDDPSTSSTEELLKDLDEPTS